MKKFFVAVLIIAVLGLGWSHLRNMSITLHGAKGEQVKVRRGNLTIPINATGEVRYKSRIEIKSEASGTVAQRFFEAGDMVAKGELLIRLTRDDEQRTVDRAEAELTRAQANLERARITRRERREVGVDRAQADLDGIIAQLTDAKHDYEFFEKLYTGEKANSREMVRTKANHDRLLASKAAAEAVLRQAKIAIEMSEQDVILAGAAHTTVEKNLSDARERLAETEIVSPIGGMVTQMLVQEGEVIQAGKGSFTGGTVLAVVWDVSEVYVRAEVDEADFGVVRDLAPPAARPGGNVSTADDDPPQAPVNTEASTVRVLVEAYRDEDFTGVIERIYPEPRRAASVVTYFVDILLTSENRDKLAMGMQADVEFTADSVYDALLVRHDAIFKEDEQLGVYVPEKIEGLPDPKPKFVKCRFGLDNGLLAQVIEGDIKEGDMVYAKLPHSMGEDKK
ncbi:MAG: efflux RND transporter periplasmic adaptor subunit [Phycisphaerae bacterium]|nr:efflux RND transporter periplasmic adaptor subunit [Phycisphaerae bacterium]